MDWIAEEAASISPANRALVIELIARYAWALDSDRAADVAGLFTEDGVFDGVSGMFEGRDRVRLMAATSRKHDDGALVQHWVANSVFAGDDTCCTVRSMCIGPAVGAMTSLAFVGTYHDRCVCTKGRWMFAYRRWRPWTGELPE